MERRVEPELLDDLPPADPRAVRSRQDLQRVNAWMGNGGVMAQALQSTCGGQASRRIAELGAGDGNFLLRVARRLPADWLGTHAVLLDRWNIVSPATHQDFAALGWHTETVQADALAWLTQLGALARVFHASIEMPTARRVGARGVRRGEMPGLAFDAMIANLFLHHFPERPLAELLRAAAGLTRTFIAVEPRRWGPSLLVSRWLWLIGCSQVTRHDARVSVRAGFAGRELSPLWPEQQGWSLQEGPAGWCSHLFIARRED